jgi:hypothetical protein
MDPIGPGRLRLFVRSYDSPEGAMMRDFRKAGSIRTTHQDIDVVVRVMRGLHAEGLPAGVHASRLEERIGHFERPPTSSARMSYAFQLAPGLPTLTPGVGGKTNGHRDRQGATHAHEVRQRQGGGGSLPAFAWWTATRAAAGPARSAHVVEYLGERLGVEHALAPQLEVRDIRCGDVGDSGRRQLAESNVKLP